jgi:hypothetical protein
MAPIAAAASPSPPTSAAAAAASHRISLQASNGIIDK